MSTRRNPIHKANTAKDRMTNYVLTRAITEIENRTSYPG